MPFACCPEFDAVWALCTSLQGLPRSGKTLNHHSTSSKLVPTRERYRSKSLGDLDNTLSCYSKGRRSRVCGAISSIFRWMHLLKLPPSQWFSMSAMHQNQETVWRLKPNPCHTTVPPNGPRQVLGVTGVELILLSSELHEMSLGCLWSFPSPSPNPSSQRAWSPVS